MNTRQIRTLIIDNNVNFLNSFEKILVTEIPNIQVKKASNPEEALQLVKDEYINLAILDKRLVQDTDPSDESGIELARAIATINPSIKIIMMTSYTDWRDIANKLPKKDEYKELITCNYISKEDEKPYEWCKKIKSVIQEDLGINLNLKIELVGFDFKKLESLLINIEYENKRVKENDIKLINDLSIELLDLFGKIYYDENEITLTPLKKQGHGGTNVVIVHHSQNLAEIFKFGGREKIEYEYNNYRSHVAGKISERTIIDEGKFSRTKNLAAIAYSLIGADIDKIEHFSEYYEKNISDNILEFLNDFFRENCKVWYDNPKSSKPVDLKELYKKYLPLTSGGLKKAVKDKFSQFDNKREIHFQDFGLALENPVFSASHAYFPPIKIKECRTHGDLNINNILVFKDRGWLIDFYSTGWGHSLRDFIKLETSIKFELTKGIPLSALIDLEKALLVPNSFLDKYDYMDKTNDYGDSLVKVFNCIKHIRKLAYDLTRSNHDMCEYYIGLFFTTLRSLQFYNIEGFTGPQNKTRLKFVLISAALIIEKLKNRSIAISTAPEIDDPEQNEGISMLSYEELEIKLRKLEEKLESFSIEHKEVVEKILKIGNNILDFKEQVKGNSLRVWHLKKDIYPGSKLKKLNDKLENFGIEFEIGIFNPVKLMMAILNLIEKEKYISMPDDEYPCKKGISEPSLSQFCLKKCEFAKECEVKVMQYYSILT